jgi:hypothetical protein
VSAVGSAVLNVQDRATVTLTRRSDDDAICACGGTVVIATSASTPTHRSEASVYRRVKKCLLSPGIAGARRGTALPGQFADCTLGT